LSKCVHNDESLSQYYDYQCSKGHMEKQEMEVEMETEMEVEIEN